MILKIKNNFIIFAKPPPLFCRLFAHLYNKDHLANNSESKRAPFVVMKAALLLLEKWDPDLGIKCKSTIIWGPPLLHGCVKGTGYKVSTMDPPTKCHPFDHF